MRPNPQSGMVLVASLIILALLSILGASALLNASLDTRLATNRAVGREAFYAAEAALELGAGTMSASFRQDLRPYVPTSTGWLAPAASAPYTNPFHGYTTSYKILNALEPTRVNAEPPPFLYTTVQNGQQILHFAYTYRIEGRAESALGTKHLVETARILETPLIQYYIFHDDHLSWHPGPAMTSWGRVHTNGDLLLSPGTGGGITFQDSDLWGNTGIPNVLTVGGVVRYGDYLFQDGSWSSRASGPVRVLVRKGSPVAPVQELVNTSITATNQGAQEARFVSAAGTGHVRIRATPLPAASFQALQRGQFYETEARTPRRTGVDGLRIVVEGGALRAWITLNGGTETEVTDLIRNYRVSSGGQLVNLAAWPAGALTNADGSTASVGTPPVAGTMVYSPENFVPRDEAGTVYTAARGAGSNPRYPSVLERTDPREAGNVDLTVIDLQRLQLWYRDYVDWTDGSFSTPPSPNVANRNLLIYVSRSLTATTLATGTGAPQQAVKVIGSRAGRTRQLVDRQSAPTLTARTTLVTDNPLYVDGDFNAPGASAGSDLPGAFGCALVSDATTLLSNSWGVTQYGLTTGIYTKPLATASSYNAAFFAGRYDFRASPHNSEEAGIHNFLRFVENWNDTVPCNVTGCLINLWFSRWASARFRCCGTGTGDVYSPPQRNFGWDVQFGNQDYWPPYVPSVYSMERTTWSEL